MHNKNAFEETHEEIPTAVLPVDHPDVVADGTDDAGAQA